MISDVLGLIRKIGAGENSLTKMEFVSPVFNSAVVATRVDGMVYTFSIPRKDPGWYRIRPTSTKRAKVLGPAGPEDVERYLRCLDRVRLVLMMKRDGVYLAIPEKSNKFALPVNEPVPVLLFDDTVMDFDRVFARYDGANFWYERLDRSNDLAKADHLRASMEEVEDPSKIGFLGLTLEEKMAYTLRFSLDKKLVEDRKKTSLKEDVEHAGGKLVRFSEKSDHYTLTYKVDGEEFSSHVSKDPRHWVISAGLCLAGNDKNFDLKSLVTVIREAQSKKIVHKGHYGGEPDYDEGEDD